MAESDSEYDDEEPEDNTTGWINERLGMTKTEHAKLDASVQSLRGILGKVSEH